MTRRRQEKPTESVLVCMFCGSPRPEELLPQCAHGLVVAVQGPELEAAAMLHEAFQEMHARRVVLIRRLDNAIANGTAKIDHAPAFKSAGDNVIPLHKRRALTKRSKP